MSAAGLMMTGAVLLLQQPERATRLKEKPQLAESALRLYFLGLEGKAYMPSPSSPSVGPSEDRAIRQRRRGWHVGLAFKT